MFPISKAIRAGRRIFGWPGATPKKDGSKHLGVQVKRVQRQVNDLRQCDFYHVVELPTGELTKGQWDLREGADQYLGEIRLENKTVLEVGPATGFLSFHMERHGARVYCVEPPMEAFWDLIPWPDTETTKQRYARHIERIRNSFWYLHGLYQSKVELYEADLYNLPCNLPRFDVAVLGSVLLHCRSPVKMLEIVGGLVDGKIVIVERFFGDLAGQPLCRLLPSRHNRIKETWWEFSPQFFEQYLGVIGFSECTITRHRQWYSAGNSWIDMFTIVASRDGTAGFA